MDQHTGNAKPVDPSTNVESLMDVIRQWAPFPSEICRPPYNHISEEDSAPLHLTKRDSESGLDPIGWIRPAHTKVWEEHAVTNPGFGLQLADANANKGRRSWCFKDEVVKGGSEAMSRALVEATLLLQRAGVVELSAKKTEPFFVHVDPRSTHWKTLPPGTETKGNAAFTFPRRWCKRLGIPIYAISLIAYKGSGRDMKIYLGIRGKKAATCPGMFDATAVGGLTAGLTETEALCMEAEEEASIPGDVIMRDAKSMGAMTIYGEAGKIEIMYQYRIKLAEDFEPHCDTDEVQRFKMMTVGEVLDLLKYNPDKIAYWAGICLVQFFMVKGIIHPGNEANFLEIQARMRQNLSVAARRISW